VEPSLPYLLTPWSTVLLQKLTSLCSRQEIPHIFMEPEGSLPYSQVPTTCPYPEPTPPSPQHPLQLPEDHLNIILPSMSGFPQWPVDLTILPVTKTWQMHELVKWA
jgi:hypothetical protein